MGFECKISKLKCKTVEIRKIDCRLKNQMGGNQIGSSPMESTGRSRKRGKEEEGKGESKLEVTEIGIPSKEGLDKAEMYHVVKEIIGFILHMHQQIPS